MFKCYRGGMKSPSIVQEGVNEPTLLSLVSTGMGVGWVLATARWRCPESVVILPVVDLNMPLTLALVWRKDNTSPLLANFIAEVRRLPEVRALHEDSRYNSPDGRRCDALDMERNSDNMHNIRAF